MVIAVCGISEKVCHSFPPGKPSEFTPANPAYLFWSPRDFRLNRPLNSTSQLAEVDLLTIRVRRPDRRVSEGAQLVVRQLVLNVCPELQYCTTASWKQTKQPRSARRARHKDFCALPGCLAPKAHSHASHARVPRVVNSVFSPTVIPYINTHV